MKNNKFFHPAKTLLIGLLLCQAAGAYFVYRSNLSIFYECQILAGNGYLTVPNQNVLYNLVQIWSALKGGLFFTLSIGAGLSTAAIVSAWIWRKVFGAHKLFLLLFVLAWAAFLVYGNFKGFNPFFTTLTVLVPPVTFLVANQYLKKSENSGSAAAAIGFILPLVIIGTLWAAQADKDIFLDIRDFLLWANPAGRWTTDAYYNNTLYAAESFKSLKQKTLKPVMVHATDPGLKTRIENTLAKRDYLPLKEAGPTDLDLDANPTELVFRHKGKVIIQTNPADFFKDPAQTLDRYSSAIDINHVFRHVTYYSILFGSTLALYFVLFGILQWIFGLFSGPGGAAILAGFGCLAIMTLLLTPVAQNRDKAKEKLPTAKLLQSLNWQDQVVGLRKIRRAKEDLSKYDAYESLLTSPHVPVRYWTARAMGVSRRGPTYQGLLKLLDDPEINVVCQAYQALSERPRAKNIGLFIERIKASKHWYVQWNAYRSLKEQGWNQNVSP